MLLGGSVLMFLVKGGTVDVLLAANAAAGPIEQRAADLRHAAQRRRGSRCSASPTAARGCSGRYLALGLALMVVYAVSVGGYLAFVVYGYRAAEGRVLIIGWTFVAALAAALLVAWITLVNLLYLLLQIAMAVDGVGVADGVPRRGALHPRRVPRAGRRVSASCFALVVAATLASALAWSGVGLIAFVPLVGLAVFPLQLAALLLRGLVFEYLGLTALGAYLTLYQGYVARRARGGQPRVGRSAIAALATSSA